MKKLILLFSAPLIFISCGDLAEENEILAKKEAQREGIAYTNFETKKTSEKDVFECGLGLDAGNYKEQFEVISQNLDKVENQFEAIDIQVMLETIDDLRKEELPSKSSKENLDLFYFSNRSDYYYVIIEDGKINNELTEIINSGVIGSRKL